MTPPTRAVPSCHAESAGVDAPAGTRVVALVGNANTGKSTLFNGLTGAGRDVGNWPGTTVAVGRTLWTPPAAEPVLLVDLPGTVSLDPQSPDERLTHQLLVDQSPAERPDLVVVVASAVQFARALYLQRQVHEQGLRSIIAVTMSDLADRRGLHLDLDRLTATSGVAAVRVDPRHGRGLDQLARVVVQALAEPPAAPPTTDPGDAAGSLGRVEDLAAAEDRFGWVAQVMHEVVRRSSDRRASWSDRIDRWTTAPVVGPLLFLSVMWVVFQATTTVAAPIQAALGALVQGPVTQAATALLTAPVSAPHWVTGLVVDGLVGGVGMVLSFVPVMAVMFACLSLLEDSGYLARAAVVTDRAMRAVGLPGRAFLPLIVGFGCNVPAISATRILPDARHRLLTALLVPFTSCSARLTVYVLVATTFFGDDAGTVVFALYVLSIVLVVLVGRLLRGTLLRTMGEDPFVLDLPPYQLPLPRLLLAGTWQRLRGFLRTAGGIIVATVVVVWALSAVPAPGAGGSFGDVPVRHSVYAAMAGGVAPAFAPAGFGDWQITSALMVGMVAKEAVISSWVQTYAVADAPGSPTAGSALSLEASLRGSIDRSSGGHSIPAILAFLVFLLAYTPCVATLAAQRREIGARWTLIGICVQLGVAWVLAVVVFQVGRILW